MSVLILSWEYPPRIVGGLGRHVHRLAEALASLGTRVHVVTRGHPEAPADEVRAGVLIHRVDEYPPRIPVEDILPWALQFNIALLQRCVALMREERPLLIHAHDWLVAYASAALKELYELPLVATIHATEYGRHQGHLPGPLQQTIHQAEWWLTFEARRVITCSQYMKDEVTTIFQLPPEKVDVVPGGVNLESFAPPPDTEEFRRRLARPEEKIVVFAGRLEYEKGVQTVLEAFPLVLERFPARFFVAGAGRHLAELERLSQRLGISDRVSFLGFLHDDDLRRLYAAADVAVVPSLYEPFGLVALETMAAGTPVVAADTGGLREIVRHGLTGLRFPPGDPASLARAIVRVVEDRNLASRLTLLARQTLARDFSWEATARKVLSVYERAIQEEEALRSSLESGRRFRLVFPSPAGAPRVVPAG